MKALHQGAVIPMLSRGVDLQKGRSMPALDSRLADKRPPPGEQRQQSLSRPQRIRFYRDTTMRLPVRACGAWRLRSAHDSPTPDTCLIAPHRSLARATQGFSFRALVWPWQGSLESASVFFFWGQLPWFSKNTSFTILCCLFILILLIGTRVSRNPPPSGAH